MTNSTTSLQVGCSAGVDDAAHRALYTAMLRARTFEQRVHELFLQNLIKGTNHLAIGQEAIAAAYAVAMQPDDYTFCTYRGHAHTLLRGAPMGRLMAELMGRATGILGGKGGSMHLTDVASHAMGSYAIVGAHLPVAVGAAWSAQHRSSGQAAVCFFGDGTTNIGAFHESLNLAATWRLPVVFVCENNMYMEYTPIGSVTAVEHPAADRAAAYGLERLLVDGNDADAMVKVAQHTLDRAHSGDGPSLVEAVTYRHGGHSRADPGKYRPDEEVQAWRALDPVVTYAQHLVELGMADDELSDMQAIVRAEVDTATDEAQASPRPDPAIALDDLWADGSSSWRR